MARPTLPQSDMAATCRHCISIAALAPPVSRAVVVNSP